MNHLCFWLGLKDVRESSNFGWTAHYRCISYRPSSVAGKRSGCKGWIKIRHSDASVNYSLDLHSSCLEALKRARLSDIAATISNATILDLSAEMYAQYDRVAKGREEAPVHQQPNLFTVPANYYTFAYVPPIA